MPGHAKAPIAVKLAGKVEKWNPGSNRETDPPDEVVTSETWVENDEVVTDPKRIAELEATIEKEQSA